MNPWFYPILGYNEQILLRCFILYEYLIQLKPLNVITGKLAQIRETHCTTYKDNKDKDENDNKISRKKART